MPNNQALGLSFEPTARAQGAVGEDRTQSGVQRAIQMLSLRLPRVVGARSIAPTALLTGTGGGQALPAVLRSLLQQGVPQQTSQTPTATVTPPVTVRQQPRRQVPTRTTAVPTGAPFSQQPPFQSVPQVSAPNIPQGR